MVPTSASGSAERSAAEQIKQLTAQVGHLYRLTLFAWFTTITYCIAIGIRTSAGESATFVLAIPVILNVVGVVLFKRYVDGRTPRG